MSPGFSLSGGLPMDACALFCRSPNVLYRECFGKVNHPPLVMLVDPAWLLGIALHSCQSAIAMYRATGLAGLLWLQMRQP